VEIISFCPRLSTFYHEQRKFLNTFSLIYIRRTFFAVASNFFLSVLCQMLGRSLEASEINWRRVCVCWVQQLLPFASLFALNL
jgi:hypothetical protein